MQRNLFIITGLLLAATMQVKAQVGIGTITPLPSAALEVKSTTKGVLIPRMLQSERTGIGAPAEGLMVYQTDAPTGLWMFISGAWVRLASTTDITNNNSLFGTNTGYAANTSGATVAVVLGGTNVPLPNSHNLGTGITIDGSNTTITVAAAGRYRIAYGVNTTATLLLSSRVLINGSASELSLVFAPILSVSRHSAESIVTLTAGSTLNLQLFGLLGAANLLGSGNGAFLSVQRVQ